MGAQDLTGLRSFRAKTSIFLALLVFRLINSQLVQTFFQPDEYFQALEPAWQMAFGSDSGAWLTWEWREGLRTSVHPYMFAAAYKTVDRMCKTFAADEHTRAAALVATPRLVQAIWAAAMDFWTWRMADRLYGTEQSSALSALALTVLSPWQWFCSVRTFSNSLETTLTILSLSLFDWTWFLQPTALQHSRGQSNKATLRDSQVLYIALAPAAAAFYLRPTNIIIWLSISICLVWYSRSVNKAIALVQCALFVGSGVVIVFASADRMYYGSWTFPPLRFLQFNIVQSLAVFYGKNRPDYYFTEGLPLLLTTALPLALTGLFFSLRGKDDATNAQTVARRRTASTLAASVVVTTLALSTIAHKEVRFIYPLLPILHVLAARSLASVLARRSTIRLVLLVVGVAVNAYIAFYVSFVHQRGVIDVMHYLRHRQEAWFDASQIGELSPAVSSNVTAGFLMPCHSTPWRSHLVYPELDAWALTCEPPINVPVHERESYMDEADVFYADPTKWLTEKMQDVNTVSLNAALDVEEMESAQDPDRRRWPQYLVAFAQLQPTLTQMLADSRYKVCKRFFNTHWHDDSRRAGDVIVWCMRR